MLNPNELEILLDGVGERLAKANREGTLQDIISRLGWDDLLPHIDDSFSSYPDGKIVILGASEVKEKVIYGIAKQFGLSKKRFDLCLDYHTIKQYEFRKLQYAPSYRVILVGPMPHKTAGSGDFSSTISALQQPDAGFPKVVELRSGSELKITKANLTEALCKMLREGFLSAG